MAAQHVARTAGWAIGCILAPLLLGSMFGRRWIAVGFLIAIAGTVWLLFWLPRIAHAAFESGRHDKARQRYRLLAMLAFTRPRERSATLSHAACDVAVGQHERAERTMGTLDDIIEPAERVVWLNNRACIALDAGRDAASALALADEAIGLRPDVPAIQHTRARALLAVGRIDDAIVVFDAMRTAGELSPQLEAERCRDLATAWERKGQGAYASDYRERARLVAR